MIINIGGRKYQQVNGCVYRLNDDNTLKHKANGSISLKTLVDCVENGTFKVVTPYKSTT